MSTDRLERRARSLSGLPAAADPFTPRWKKVVTNGWLWTIVAVLLVGAYGLVDTYRLEHTPRPVPGGEIPGISNQAFKKAASYAWRTAAVWVLVFLWLDRFRKNRIASWVVAFLWGALISTWVSLYLNTWAGSLLNVRGDGDPAAASRPAVYVAPFVEEAAKATVIMLIAIMVRYRLVSRMQTVTLAGLSAIGFAFTENILYYARAWEYATLTQEAGDPDAAMHQLVMLRGVYTSFGHPLFTTFTGIGLALGLRQRSKVARILWPLAGFTMAVCGHMMFNGTASVMQENQKMGYWFSALALVAVLAGMLVVWLFGEGRRIRARLTDLVAFGWLLPSDPRTFGSLWRRLRMLLIALSQPRRLPATVRLMRNMTELAYLRDSMVLGLVDAIGYERARELLNAIRADRPVAVWQTDGEHFVWPPVGRWTRQVRAWASSRRAPQFAPPSGPAFPPPSGQVFAPPGGTPAPGAPQWAPPRR